MCELVYANTKMTRARPLKRDNDETQKDWEPPLVVLVGAEIVVRVVDPVAETAVEPDPVPVLVALAELAVDDGFAVGVSDANNSEDANCTQFELAGTRATYGIAPISPWGCCQVMVTPF